MEFDFCVEFGGWSVNGVFDIILYLFQTEFSIGPGRDIALPPPSVIVLVRCTILNNLVRVVE